MIDRYRKEIDTIDDQIVALLIQRLKIVEAIGQAKASHHQTIRHLDREKAIITRLTAHQSTDLKKLISKIYPIIFKMSCLQQKRVVKKNN